MRKNPVLAPIAILTLSILNLIFCGCNRAEASKHTLQSAQAVLSARENQFAQTTFLWNVEATKKQPGPDPKDLARARKSVAQQTEVRAGKMGMTDEGQIQRFVQRELTVLQNAEEGYNFHFTNHWRFSNNGQTTEVVGQNQFTPHTVFDCYERYEDKQGLTATTDLKSAGIAHVWATSGNSTQFFSPFQNGLNLSPEDFALFAGKNPLKMYAADWKVISSTDNALVLETQQTSGAFTPFQMSMTLDPKHGYLPSRIQATGKIWSAEYTVQNYHKDKNGWVPSRVMINEHWFDLQISRELTLVATNSSDPILSKIPNLSIVDYRLIGENPLTAQVEDADRHQDPRIMAYSWSGNLPSLAELKKLNGQRSPGESTPDPGKSGSAIPVAGGLMCLVGGVWMFKRRGIS